MSSYEETDLLLKGQYYSVIAPISPHTSHTSHTPHTLPDKGRFFTFRLGQDKVDKVDKETREENRT
ncbi:MAG: hypothetical protein F6K47_40755 [Symploca sp. SIO2E6]|nr:hypothetical protein [Symploca sp. SIO2E6]